MNKQPCNCQAAYGCQYDDMKAQGRDGFYYCMAGRDAYEHHVAATTACPLCGSREPHKHTPTEQVIYRNGFKAGRSQSDSPAGGAIPKDIDDFPGPEDFGVIGSPASGGSDADR